MKRDNILIWISKGWLATFMRHGDLVLFGHERTVTPPPASVLRGLSLGIGRRAHPWCGCGSVWLFLGAVAAVDTAGAVFTERKREAAYQLLCQLGIHFHRLPDVTG